MIVALGKLYEVSPKMMSNNNLSNNIGFFSFSLVTLDLEKIPPTHGLHGSN